MLGRVVEEKFAGYDVIIIFNKETNDEGLIKVFSFFDNRDLYYIKEILYGGSFDFHGKKGKKQLAKSFCVRVISKPSEIGNFVSTLNRNPSVLRSLTLRIKDKDMEKNLTHFSLSSEDKKEDFSIYRDLLKSIIQS